MSILDYIPVSVIQYSLLGPRLNLAILYAFCHAVYTCVFVAGIYLIFSSKSYRSTRVRLVFCGIISYLWCTETVALVTFWVETYQILIVHGGSFEEEARFSFVPSAAEIPNAILRGSNVTVAGTVMMWRCWNVYGRSKRILAVLVLCFIGEAVAFGLLISRYNPSGHAVASTTAHLILVYYYVMTITTNIVTTGLIMGRVFRVSGFRRTMKTYHGLIEILIESAILYCVAYIVLTVVYAYEFYFTDNLILHIYQYPRTISCSITGIAPTLIIARIMAGHARPNDSWTRTSLPHMESRNHRSLGGSLRFASGPHRSQTRTTNIGFDFESALAEQERSVNLSGAECHDLEEEDEGKRKDQLAVV